MIKNIVFDIGNVILEGTFEEAILGSDLDEFAKDKIVAAIKDESLLRQLDRGNIDLHKFYEIILGDDIDKYFSQIINIYEQRAFNREVENLLISLSEKYRIFVLSDNNELCFNVVKSSPIAEKVYGWCISYFYNATKADGDLFEVFFDKFDLNPYECFFIDDKEENIAKAKEFGMGGFCLDWKNNGIDDLLSSLQLI